MTTTLLAPETLLAPKTGRTPELSNRDRALLRAVAAGRCVLSGLAGLRIDGLFCADQFAAGRLSAAGLIGASGGGAAQLTAAGRAAVGLC